LLAEDLGYWNREENQAAAGPVVEIKRMLAGFLRRVMVVAVSMPDN
jgi:hypothetical protein